MNTWSFYDTSTGLFTGQRFSGAASDLQANTPTGCAPVEGAIHHLKYRVMGGVVEEWQPPKPADTEFHTWGWDESVREWRATPTQAATAKVARQERDRRLASCDWVVAKASEEGTAVPKTWREYRKALRDVPDQPGFPNDIVWPTPPSA